MKWSLLIKLIIAQTLFFLVSGLRAQETPLLFKQADNLERGFKEPEALAVYRQILVIDPLNIKALVKATELSCSTGERDVNKNNKRLIFESALAFAQRAVRADSNNADSYYAMALASSKMAEVESENRKVVGFIRDTRFNADKAIKLNSNHAMANFIEGKWHYEMITLNWEKRFAAKTLYGGLPNADIEQAIMFLEKSRNIDPYFMPASIILAKAYRYYNKPSKEIEVLSKAVKLPIRMIGDTGLKAEAQKRLAELE